MMGYGLRSYEDMDGPDEEPEIEVEDDDNEGPRFTDAIDELTRKLATATKLIEKIVGDPKADVEVWRTEARAFLGIKTVRFDLDVRQAGAVLMGRKVLILPAAGPAAPPRYAHPPAASEGNVLEFYHKDGRLFGSDTFRVTSVQAISMEISGAGSLGPPVAWSQVGREIAAFPCYSTEEDELDRMDGWSSQMARINHYCPDGKRFDGHIIWWRDSNG